MSETLVPDTSVLIDGRITELVRSGDYRGARVLVPLAALAELEAQANKGLETGIAGLDELATLQRMAEAGDIQVAFVGTRPTSEEIERAASGAIDALIRDTAVENKGLFVTSDRVSAHAAAAQGIRHHYVRPIVKETPDLSALKLWSYFDAETMSVHLKSDCKPMVKRGRPGEVRYEEAAPREMGHKDLRQIVRECIEYAKRDYSSFIEMEKAGCTVLQIGPMRVTIAQPPFSDGLELTAVRPITKKVLEDYELSADLRDRIEGRNRGIFVSGPPGSGKSTFAAAVAEHLHAQHRVVKTMEQPRDLQVPKEITQYGALERDMQWTGDVILLVRPDNVIYDEVRTTDDFRVYADMRLAGVGLIGVTHANRPIDAIQRLLGRVDLGMVPQVVDTVLFIDGGAVAGALDLQFTVKVPEGMTMEDLARPVVVVKDLFTGRASYELYTYGEQVVVMPLEQAGGGRSSGANALAEKELVRSLRRFVQGRYEVKVQSPGRATLYVEETEVPQVIGKGGRTVQSLERKLGISLDIKPFPHEAARAPRPRPEARDEDESYRREMREARQKVVENRIRIKRTGSNVFLLLEDAEGGRTYRVEAEGAVIGEATASAEGRLRFKADSPEGMALLEADKRGLVLECVPQ